MSERSSADQSAEMLKELRTIRETLGQIGKGSIVMSQEPDQKALVLTLIPVTSDAIERDKLQDILHYLACKFGWDIKEASKS